VNLDRSVTRHYNASMCRTLSGYMLLVLSEVKGGSLYVAASDDIINKKSYEHYRNTIINHPIKEIYHRPESTPRKLFELVLTLLKSDRLPGLE
jgi:hypothetical protein